MWIKCQTLKYQLLFVKWNQKHFWLRTADAWEQFKSPNVCLRRRRRLLTNQHNWQRFLVLFFTQGCRVKEWKDKGQRSVNNSLCSSLWRNTLFLCLALLVGVFAPKMYPTMHRCCRGRNVQNVQERESKMLLTEICEKTPDLSFVLICLFLVMKYWFRELHNDFIMPLTNCRRWQTSSFLWRNFSEIFQGWDDALTKHLNINDNCCMKFNLHW